MSVLRLDGATFAYRRGGFRLGPVEAELGAGEVLALLGHNGAGKTTWLCLAAGVHRPAAGTVHILGRAAHDRANSTTVGVASSRFRSPPRLRVDEAVEAVCRLRHLPAPAALTERLLDELGLAEVRHRQVRHLSDGESRRLGLAAALAGDPPLLLLDEPFANVDPLTTRRIVQLVEAARDRGAAVVVSSHDLPHVQRIASRIVFLHRGTQVFEGAAEPATASLGDDADLEDLYLALSRLGQAGVSGGGPAGPTPGRGGAGPSGPR